jgi:hypothetical protein
MFNHPQSSNDEASSHADKETLLYVASQFHHILPPPYTKDLSENLVPQFRPMV